MDINSMKEKFKEKVEKVKVGAQEKVKKVGDFFEKYPEAIPGVITIAFSTIAAVGGIVSANENKRMEGCRVEDDITGLDFVTKHPLSNSEILELGSRMIDGQPKGDALDDMGLLRKERRR